LPNIASHLAATWRGRTSRAWALRGVCGLAVVVCVGLLVQRGMRHRAEQARQFVEKGGLIGQVLYANLRAEHGDYADAAGAFDKIARDHAGTEVGAEALIHVAGMWRAAHERAKAAGAYEKLIKEYPNSPWRHGAEFGLRDMATAGKGEQWKDDPAMAEFRAAARLQNLGQYGAAATRFENLARAYPKHELAPFALLEAGNCYFLDDRSGDAEKRWRQVIERCSNSAWRTDADFALRAVKSPTLRESLRKTIAE